MSYHEIEKRVFDRQVKKALSSNVHGSHIVDVDLPYDLLRSISYHIDFPVSEEFLQAYASSDALATEQFFAKVNPKEGKKMNRKQVLEAELARLQAELAKLNRFPDDTFEEGTVLRFTIKFPGNSQLYKYAAIKANTVWWITGSTSRTKVIKTWDELIEWWGDRAQSIEVMERKFDLLNGPQANEVVTVNAEAYETHNPLYMTATEAKAFESKYSTNPPEMDADYDDRRGVDY